MGFDRFRVFLLDKKSATYFHLNNFNMDSSLYYRKGQIKIVKIKVAEETYLEDDPKSNCKNYNVDFEYHKEINIPFFL